jgi:hypothetical protein
MRKALVLFFVASFVTIIACGGGQGDSCDEEGKVGGQCDDGLVCGKQKSATEGVLVCLKQCQTGAECGANEDCNGVGKTSLKGCRAK